MDITIAIDAMGGDHGPHVTVPAALDALKKDNQLNIVLVGLEDAIQAELKAHKFKPDKAKKCSSGEWWLAPPNDYPCIFLQYFGENKDHFDREQLSHVLNSKDSRQLI